MRTGNSGSIQKMVKHFVGCDIVRNDAQVSLGGIILIVAVIIILIIMAWFLLMPPSCDIEDQVQLQGVLLGFEKNNTLWDVRLGNDTYIFQHFDKNYMEKMLGYNVTIIVCRIGKHYNFISAYISEEVD